VVGGLWGRALANRLGRGNNTLQQIFAAIVTCQHPAVMEAALTIATSYAVRTDGRELSPMS